VSRFGALAGGVPVPHGFPEVNGRERRSGGPGFRLALFRGSRFNAKRVEALHEGPSRVA
jgi:hypothetical protein